MASQNIKTRKETYLINGMSFLDFYRCYTLEEHKLDRSKDTIIPTVMSTESEDSSLTKKYHHQIAEKALGIVFYLGYY